MSIYRGDDQKDEIDFNEQVENMATRLSVPETLQELTDLISKIVTEGNLLERIQEMAMAERILLASAGAARGSERDVPPPIYTELYEWLKPYRSEGAYIRDIVHAEGIRNNFSRGALLAAIPGIPGITLLLKHFFDMLQKDSPDNMHFIVSIMLMFLSIVFFSLPHVSCRVAVFGRGEQKIPKEYQPIFATLLEAYQLKNQSFNSQKMIELVARLELLIGNLNAGEEGMIIDQTHPGRYRIAVGEDGQPEKFVRVDEARVRVGEDVENVLVADIEPEEEKKLRMKI